MNQTEIERLRQERDLALNTAVGAVAERDAAYTAVTRANRERDEARAEVERLKKERNEERRMLAFYKRREEHFAKALGVADGGQYRNDWDAAIDTLLKDRDSLHARVAELEKALDAEKKQSAFYDLQAQRIMVQRDTADGTLDTAESEVERLKRERDELQAKFDRMSGIAEEFRHQRERAYEESIALGAALEDSRRTVLEEAAGIAERTAGGLGPHGRCGARCVAAAIRAAAKEER